MQLYLGATVVTYLLIDQCFVTQKLRAQCVANKEKQQLNGQIVIIHEFQLSEILTRADFYCDAQIINSSIKPTAICEVVNDLIGELSPSWLLTKWYTKTFLD